MSIETKYNPGKTEEKWYEFWRREGLFHSQPDHREAYTVVIPPPNVTGVLHMGHILNNTIQDILVRRARLLGKNACWVPGTDHASIATEAKVVALLAERGILKKDITREEFLKHAWEWKEKHNGIIFRQLEKLGVSCDWDRARFTLDKSLYEAVIKVFVRLHNEGKIYRGARMINWDPKAKTALSDEEVIRKEVQSNLFHVKYRIKGGDQSITIATTRPETILGDTAICVHPGDERYRHLRGMKVIVPIVEREVPVIFDEYVDKEFGSGALKVTPAHDVNDYNLGLKHNLEVIDTLNDDGTMSEVASIFAGLDRLEARKQIVKVLKERGLISKVEEIVNNIGYSERNPDTVVEPKLSTQWFLRMDELVKPAIKSVAGKEIRIHPVKFEKTYMLWLENIKDWCISRQLWWGHRIPAWYDNTGDVVVAVDEKEALAAFEKKGKKLSMADLRQDEDVLDTWFSAWLWPFSVFGWNEDENNKDLQYYYPTNDLVTGHDIIFFWVARMIMAGYHFTGMKPFGNVYFTGMVRDKQGRKMSKQLGNSPEALKLIEEFGADGVRMGMMLSAPAGNDLHFDEALCLQGRNFANKVWNAHRLVAGWSVDSSIPADDVSILAGNWFESRLNSVLEELNGLYTNFRISEALMTTYKLIWDDFCSWYLEMIKAEFGKPVSEKVHQRALGFFRQILVILHPFMPFITEEIWSRFGTGERSSIMTANWPVAGKVDAELLRVTSFNQELVSAIRQVRKDSNIPFRDSLKLLVDRKDDREIIGSMLKKMAKVSEIGQRKGGDDHGKSIIIGKVEFFIPLEKNVDTAGEKERITKEMEYTRGFLMSIESKLNNKRFMESAPEKVVEMERQKLADATAKLEVLKKQLNSI